MPAENCQQGDAKGSRETSQPGAVGKVVGKPVIPRATSVHTSPPDTCKEPGIAGVEPERPWSGTSKPFLAAGGGGRCWSESGQGQEEVVGSISKRDTRE